MTIEGDHHLSEVFISYIENFPLKYLNNNLFFSELRLPLPEAFTKYGNLLSCGQNEVGQLGFNDNVIEKTRPALVVDETECKVIDISAGGMHSLYLTTNGEVWSFGCNDEGS